MADPQLENGYVKIANELIEALCKTNLMGAEFMIALTVIRKTYGWDKKEDKISLTQFQKMTLMSRPRVVRSIKRLLLLNVLGSNAGDTTHTSTYWIIKDYHKWLPSNAHVPSNAYVTRPSNAHVTDASYASDKKVVTPALHTTTTIQQTLKETIKEIISQNEVLLSQFSAILKDKVVVYLSRIALKNKSKIITEGRKNTLLSELVSSRGLCNNDLLFGQALDASIDRDACCIGYVNAVIKNRKTQKPR